MTTKFVQVLCDVDCEWQDVSPRYRITVNGELFTERTWIWRDAYLEEIIPIEAEPGIYKIDFSMVNDGVQGKIITSNFRVGVGDGTVVAPNTVEIMPYEVTRNL